MHSISALMLTNVPAADRMMTRLSDLLRNSLDAASTQITTLSHELEFVNCYLEIEKVRFEERMNLILDIAPETLDAQIPHLLRSPWSTMPSNMESRSCQQEARYESPSTREMANSNWR